MNTHKKVIFLSGAKGFIGSHIAPQLQGNYQIVPLEKDIRSIRTDDLHLNLTSTTDKYFIHLASLSSVNACAEDPDLAMKINAEGTLNCYQAFNSIHPDGTFFNFSTAHVYKSTVSSSEEKISETADIEPQSYYGETKLAAELMLERHVSQSKIYNLRLFNHTHRTQSPTFFMPSIYTQLLAAANKREKCILTMGDLSLKRDISHVDDLVDALCLLLEIKPPEPFYTLNVCSGVGKSLQALANLLIQSMGINTEIIVDPSRFRTNEPRSIVGSNDRLKSLVDWSAKRSSSELTLVKHFLG